ncbi:hypothetical protein [Flavisericum labens]|uniref:hypothetical protein n=1 Tax=Flavisericum labens TaxID=3377112 RepID=UPI00387B85FE
MRQSLVTIAKATEFRLNKVLYRTGSYLYVAFYKSLYLQAPPYFSFMEKNAHIKSKFPLILLIVLGVISCGGQKRISNTETAIETAPKILFINYKVEKTADNTVSVKLINNKVVDGKLKAKNTSEQGEVGDLICLQIDENNTILQTQIIKHPFIKVIEYVDETNSFQKKRLDLDSMQLSLRLQLKKNTKYIIIENFNIEKNNTKPLIKTKVN